MTMTTADRSRCSVQVRQLLAQGSLFLLQQLPAAAATRRAVGPLRDPSLSIALSIELQHQTASHPCCGIVRLFSVLGEARRWRWRWRWNGEKGHDEQQVDRGMFTKHTDSKLLRLGVRRFNRQSYARRRREQHTGARRRDVSDGRHNELARPRQDTHNCKTSAAVRERRRPTQHLVLVLCV